MLKAGADNPNDDDRESAALAAVCTEAVFVVSDADSKAVLLPSAVDIALEEAVPASSSGTAQRDRFHIRSQTPRTFLANGIQIDTQILLLARVW